MARLKLELKEMEQRGQDAFVRLGLSEKDGPKSISVGLTLHNVRKEDVEVKEGGMLFVSEEGAPVYVSFGKPEEGIF